MRKEKVKALSLGTVVHATVLRTLQEVKVGGPLTVLRPS